MSAVSTIDVHLLELPLTEPFTASHGQTLDRTIVAIRVTTDGGVGWGECSALPAATYTAESAVGTFQSISETLAPRLIGATVDVPMAYATEAGSGATPGDSKSVSALLDDVTGQPMAIAGLEMAVFDAALKARGQSLARWMGVEVSSVPAGVSIGLDTVEATVAKATGLAHEGYGRLKVKVQPGHDAELVTALRRELPDIELQVDANGSYPASAVDDVLRLAELGANAIEQPFAPSAPTSAIELIDRLQTIGLVPVIADEAVATQADAETLLSMGAMTGLSIKPARVGGLVAALSLHRFCLAAGLAATAGGMLETGLGRHALAVLAGLPGFTVTGDLSPAARWLAADPWPDLTMAAGRIDVPAGPGVAPDPDPYLLERYRLEHRRVG